MNKLKTFKPDWARIRFYLYLCVVIPSVLIIGLTFAYPTDPAESADVPLLDRTGGSRSLAELFFKGHEDDLAGKIRSTKRIMLLEATAFKRISRIHDILSRFKTGLSVLEEERLARQIYVEGLRYGYDPELIISVILTESSFYKRAHSNKGAIGLMQILPMTGRELADQNRIALRHTDDLFDPQINVQLGTNYLAQLHEQFGDMRLALIAYNQGPGRVTAMLGRGDQLPTGYSQKVLFRYRQLLEDESPEAARDALQRMNTSTPSIRGSRANTPS
ncbi:MAG TPA: lytic transglycosylase domain-containing protein [Nitrospiria bacterium]